MQITNNGFLVTMTIIIIMALPVLIIRNSMKKTQEEIKKTHAENKNIAVKDNSSKMIQSLLEKIKNLESTKKPTTKKPEKMKPCVWTRCV